MVESKNFFGVRHLSATTSYNLLQFLEAKKPKCILMEGPSDATDLLLELANKNVIPPVALMAYTTELPIQSVLYPFALYSPEYQATLWAKKNKSNFRLIDLPTEVSLALKTQSDAELAEQQEALVNYRLFHNDLYDQLATLNWETDYESYWERKFEHCLDSQSYQERICYQSQQIRDMVIDTEREADPVSFAHNYLREAYMKRQIEQALLEGFAAEDIVVIVGAYHVSGLLDQNLTALTEKECEQLPKQNALATLMPYSYYRLSSRTGYGAGNKAPYYFELMWQHLVNNNVSDLAANYLSRIGKELREKGFNASTASTIEAVKLAQALSHLKGGQYPVLKDLHDAALTCFGEGQWSKIAEAINHIDIGTNIGSLPKGMSKTPIQKDFYEQINTLKLDEYVSAVDQVLTLDLRENIRVKSQEIAFRDLNRSTFLHQLTVLEIPFAIEKNTYQQNATWSEQWNLRWTTEAEIAIIENSLLGETIAIATAFKLKEQLDHTSKIGMVANIIRQAYNCNLTHLFETAIIRLQAILVETEEITDLAQATFELAKLVQFGDLRQFDLLPLKPILRQLFLRASLLLVDSCNCDQKAADEVTRAIDQLNFVAQEFYEDVDINLWIEQLHKVATRDDLNYGLSGLCLSILLERNLLTEVQCTQEVNRRLSHGVPADLAAAWFEGIARRNKYALLSRVMLWEQLNDYVANLDEQQYMHALVFLRRTFSGFDQAQKNSIVELLSSIWGTDIEVTSEELLSELSEEQTQTLDDLNDFDFDF
ncbi:DUF5682 family protein [Myroides pelagicus]|uniref:Uncharacterized protein n=1 Tax=Myroides pelagicus TaxID=270914 RepID=A0A7K1GQ62_9FLAO|nr:DUF5682 family protein [Myroides pelagicus]MEC4114216.1 DUF5682 family protein [Myroides pelagicus]MTH30870.1 hypothetical protein [Myroides pelagicus]